MKLYIDFGGTHFRYQLDDGDVVSLSSKTFDLKNFLDEILLEHKIDFIGISFAGQVKNGVILSAPNISIQNFDVKSYIKEKYNIKVEIQNDLTSASLAELSLRKSKILVLLYIGTGFGSGVVIDGKPLIGANNLATEIGHMPFFKTDFLCGCGRDDCIELSCSGRALENFANKFAIKNYSLESLKNSNLKEARFIYTNFLNALFKSFHIILNLFDPDTIILGGSVLLKNKFLLQLLQKELQNSSFKNLRQDVKIEFSTLNNGSLEGCRFLEKL